MTASHQLLEHTGEVRLRIRAATLAGLLAEAGRALSGLMLRGQRPGSAGVTWENVVVESRDRAALLVDWLNELIYRAEREWAVPVEFQVHETGPATVRARVGAVPVPEPPALVKAATLHGARVERLAEGMEADVILDV